eukprot:CAMPEP_0172017344 /NCGR_PEP_ID=MMETSP1041-20130122/11514_1 /TAXON_ID=464988 /ORGANISM="Hemiselmis andersenii, Strain CCMP439" /LENGTH=178 /DNA_ID=CAMNT_0012672367 /DNA_START=282 /DNA_END=819 /DNA_ORIENTATION=+
MLVLRRHFRNVVFFLSRRAVLAQVGVLPLRRGGGHQQAGRRRQGVRHLCKEMLHGLARAKDEGSVRQARELPRLPPLLDLRHPSRRQLFPTVAASESACLSAIESASGSTAAQSTGPSVVSRSRGRGLASLPPSLPHELPPCAVLPSSAFNPTLVPPSVCASPLSASTLACATSTSAA